LGAPLNTIDDFKEALHSDGEDSDDGNLDRTFVKEFHFGGGGVGNEKEAEGGVAHRSKRDVMAEVMMKSKAAKLDKKQQKESDEGLREQLDQKFAALQQVRPPDSNFSSFSEHSSIACAAFTIALNLAVNGKPGQFRLSLAVSTMHASLWSHVDKLDAICQP
jgi:hypothetical protein